MTRSNLRLSTCLFCSLALSLGLVSASDAAVVSIGSTNVPTGQPFTLSLTVALGSSAFGTCNIDVNYDANILQVTNAANGSLELEEVTLNWGEPGIVHVLAQNTDSLSLPTGLVTIATIDFVAIGPGGTNSTLPISVIELLNPDVMDIPFTTSNGVVNLLAALTAAFTGTPTTGAPPLAVTFTDTSSGTITNRSWVFGDGGTTNTTATSVPHTYTNVGTFTVSLTTMGPDGSNMLTRTNYITVGNPPPQLTVQPGNRDFGAVVVGQTNTLAFSAFNTGGGSLTGTAAVAGPFAIASGSPFIVSAGMTGTVNVSFIPVSAGTFSNSAIFTSNGGGSTNPVTGTSGIVPVASFTGSPTSGVAPLMVTFSDTSTGTIANRFWTFGDGMTTNTTTTSVPHTYTSAGTFPVSLNVSGPVGANMVTRNGYIVVTNIPPILSVTPASRNFGSVTIGQTTTQSFQVANLGQLTLNGTAAVAAPFAIAGGSPFNIVGGATGTVNVAFTPVASGTVTNTVAFASNGGASSNSVIGTGLTPGMLGVSPSNLNFGAVATGAVVQASFVVTNKGESALSGTATALGGPFSILSGTPFNIAGFGSTSVVVRYSPVSAGGVTNSVAFSSNGGGSTNSVFGQGSISPVAGFTGSPTNGAPPLVVTFTNASTGTITNRLWNFGDGATTNSAAATVAHTYTNTGTFTVSLSVTGPLGSNTLTRANYITVSNVPPQLTVQPGSRDFGSVIVGHTNTLAFSVINAGGGSLTGTTAVGGPFAIAGGSPFNVAAGMTGTVNVSFIPVSAGSFSNSVIFTSNGGSSTNPVTGSGSIVPIANFTGSPTSGVAPLMVTFSDASAGTITNRHWDFGDGMTTNTAATNVVHTYNSPGTNTVTLTVSGPAGSNQFARADYIVVANAPPTLDITDPSENETFTNANITVMGTASDDDGIKSVTVDGIAATVVGTNWSRALTLGSGTNTITVIATDNSAGMNAVTQTVHAILESVEEGIEVSIASPTNGSPVAAVVVDVSGQATAGSAVTVTNNRGGSVAAIFGGATNWTATAIPLKLGTNILTATATRGTNSASDMVTVVRVPTNVVDTTFRTVKASVTRGNGPNTDSLSVSGVYNDADVAFDPTTDTVEVLFGDYEAMLPPNSLSNFKFKAKASPTNTLTSVAISAKKRTFSFAASSLTLTNTDPFMVAAALGSSDLGPDGITFPVTSLGSFAYAYGTQLPNVDQFFLGKSKLTTNTFQLAGNVNIVARPSALVNPVTFGIGTFEEILPAGGWTSSAADVYTYTRPAGHPGKVETMSLNLSTGTWSAKGTGADLSFLAANPTTDIRLEITDFAASYRAKLVAKGKGFKY